MNTLDLEHFSIPSQLIVIGLPCISILLLLIAKRIVFSRIRRSRTVIGHDIILSTIHALERPSGFLIVLVNLKLLEVLASVYGLKLETLAPLIKVSESALLIVILVLFSDRLVTKLVRLYFERQPSLKSGENITRGLLRGFILSLGVLILMSTLGISITPIIASLGISSLAVALAMQPTLENFFSGVQLIIDKPIRVGDFIELDSGEQGFVEKIGWRSTWIKMLPNNVVIMPNGLLAKSKLINYYYPEKQLSVPVEVGVHYDSDLEHVEQVTLDVARLVLKQHKWGISDYETFVVFHTFDSSSINFTVMLRAEEYFNRFFIKSEFIKQLHKRYAKEGITIPYPISAINTSQESPRFSVADTGNPSDSHTQATPALANKDTATD